MQINDQTITLQVKRLLDEDWDLVVIDDLFWAIGFAIPVLRYRLWENGGGRNNGKEPRFLVYSTAGQTLMSAEAVKATGTI